VKKPATERRKKYKGEIVSASFADPPFKLKDGIEPEEAGAWYRKR
jgi:hypothetical protein